MEDQEREIAGGTHAWPSSLLNGSEMGRRVYHYDWSSTPLGPISSWPTTLRSYVGLMIDHKFAMYIFWGPDDIAIYNDEYAIVAGNKHPVALGRPTRETWAEVWSTIAPLLAQVKRGDAVRIEDFKLTLHRFGFPEEFYHTLSYSPLRDDSGHINGVLSTFTETTASILAHRRLEILRQLALSTGGASTEAASFAEIAQTLAASADIPHALIYLADEKAQSARLAAQVGDIPASWDLRSELDMTAVQEKAVTDVAQRTVTVPIMAADRRSRMGVFVAGMSPSLRFDDAYCEFLVLVAAQIADSLAAARAAVEERDRAEAALLTRTVSTIALFAESGQLLVWTSRPDGWIDWYNGAWYDYTGQTAEEAAGWGWFAVTHPDDVAGVRRLRQESLDLSALFEMTFRLRAKDGGYAWFLTRAVPEFDEDGNVCRWYGCNTNVDFERQAAQQLDVFARIGGRIGLAPDAHSALRALSEALVPDFADWTLINLAAKDGALVLHEGRHRDREMTALLAPFLGTSYELPESRSDAAGVYATGASVVYENLAIEQTRGRTRPEFEKLLETFGLHSLIIVPIVAGGEILGTFHAVRSESSVRYKKADLPFFEEIGRRIGYALKNAQAFERESFIARSFQDAALPACVPCIPGMCFSTLYEPASSGARVGGDFFDAFRLLDGRLVLSIGDVAGSGLSAAATMGALRQSIRAAASINPDPELLLKAAEGVFSESGHAAFASAFVAVIDPLTWSMQYANAGHPPPLLRLPDGHVITLAAGGMLLGVPSEKIEGSREVCRTAIEPGSLLVLYTDGLTEATRDLARGEEVLAKALSVLQPSTAAAAAGALRDAVLGHQGAAHDDVAILTALFEYPLLEGQAKDLGRWEFDCGDGLAASRARNEIVEKLRENGVHSEHLFAAELIFSELVGNALRYACAPLEVALDLTQPWPTLHVLDRGPGFALNPKLPTEIYAETGRGLYIVSQLSRDFTTSPRTLDKGTHARVVLCGEIRRAQASDC